MVWITTTASLKRPFLKWEGKIQVLEKGAGTEEKGWEGTKIWSFIWSRTLQTTFGRLECLKAGSLVMILCKLEILHGGKVRKCLCKSSAEDIWSLSEGSSCKASCWLVKGTALVCGGRTSSSPRLSTQKLSKEDTSVLCCSAAWSNAMCDILVESQR